MDRILHISCSTIVLLVALFFVVTEASAQPYAGGFAQVGVSFESSNVQVYPESDTCVVFEHGTAFASVFGGELMLPDFFTSDIGAIARLGLSFSSGRLTGTPDPTRVFDPNTGELMTLDRVFRLSFSQLALSVDLLARLSLDERWAIAFGPSFGYRLSSSFKPTDNILGPGDLRFDDGQSEHVITNGPTLNQSSLMFAPMLSGMYLAHLSERTRLTSEVSVSMDLLSSVRDASWQRVRLGIGGSLLFDLAPAPQRDTLPLAESTPLGPLPHLSASVEVFAVDREGVRIAVPRVSVREILYRQHRPLLPVVFFDRDSLTPAARYVLLNASQVDTLNVTHFGGLDILRIQREVLNILGRRMLDHPGTRVVLYGSSSSEETPLLARSRAEVVRNYLVNIWGINGSRVRLGEGRGTLQRSTEATIDGREDNRRVEILPDDRSLLDPVVTEQILRNFDPPSIQVNPSYKADAGLRSWTITIRQNGREIAHYSNRDTGAWGGPEPVWDIAQDQVDSTLAPVEATLTVEDSTGAIVTAHSSVPLTLESRRRVVDRRVQMSGDRERITYPLVAFDYNSFEPGRQNEAQIKSLAQMIRDSATVSITGFTDRIGAEHRNTNLSSDRATRVADLLKSFIELLGIEHVQTIPSGVGVETLRYGNDTPEGRMLSRGVDVVVEQILGAGRR